MTDEEWDSLDAWTRGEIESAIAEQDRVNRVRVRGLVLALGAIANKAYEKVQVAERRLTEARANAERALEEEKRTLEFAATFGGVVLRDDPAEYERVALALEEMGF